MMAELENKAVVPLSDWHFIGHVMNVCLLFRLSPPPLNRRDDHVFTAQSCYAR
jgi:hypothetical protein